MAMTMHLDIVSAEAEIFSGVCEVVVAPAATGEVGIYPRHTQLMAPLKAGEVKVTKQGGEEETFYVSGGILEVQPHTVTILSDTCVRASDLDEAAALEAKQAAEAELSEKAGEVDLAAVQKKLAQAVAQLQMIQNMRKKTGR